MGVVPPLPSFNKLIADLSKVIGGGYPLAAVAGKTEKMGQLAPLSSVYQAGTSSGNPVATTAGLATLKLCDDALYAKLDKKAIKVGSSISSAFI